MKREIGETDIYIAKYRSPSDDDDSILHTLFITGFNLELGEAAERAQAWFNHGKEIGESRCIVESIKRSYAYALHVEDESEVSDNATIDN